MANNYWINCKLYGISQDFETTEKYIYVLLKDWYKIKLFASTLKLEKLLKTKPELFNKISYFQIKIEGHLGGFWPTHWKNEDHLNEGYLTIRNRDERLYFLVVGKVINDNCKNKKHGNNRVMKAKNLYVYYYDENDMTKLGDNVIVILYKIMDLKPIIIENLDMELSSRMANKPDPDIGIEG